MRAGVLSLIFVCTAALATTYRWVDADGVVHYSDQPGPGAKKIDLPEAQTYRAPPAPAVSVSATPAKPAAAYQTCAVAQPASEATVFENEAVTVSVSLQPPQRPGDTVTLTFDGTSMGPTAREGLDFRISPIDRGAHTVSVTVRDSDNKTVCSSAPITFYVRQPTVLAPQSPTKAK
jgi:hypothetical protein